MEDLTNYQQQVRTIDVMHANIFSVNMLMGLMVVFGIPYYLLWFDDLDHVIAYFSTGYTISSGVYLLTFFVMIFVGVALHELIHGITFSLFAKKGFKAIRFGILKKMLTPYCHCNEPLKKSHYFTGALMPGIVLGLVPAVTGLALGNLWLLTYGVCFTAAASGDFLLVKEVRKEHHDSFILDHPDEIGYYVLRKVDV